MTEKERLKNRINLLKKEDNTPLNDYVDETIKCFENNCDRATIILLWSIWMFYLYIKIREYGLNNFKKFIKSKNIKFEGAINNIYDLQKIKDRDLLFLCRELGFYDKNIENQLGNLSNLRNSCAHVAQLNISKYQLFSYIEQICNYINIINELDYKKIHEPFLDELKKMNEDKIVEIIPDLGFDILLSYVEQILGEVILISDYQEASLKEGYYLFLSNVAKYRSNDDERVKLFETIFKKIYLEEIPFAFKITEKFLEVIPFSVIKKLILEKDYLDYIIAIFMKSHSFVNARANARVLLLFKKNFNPKQLETIAHAYLTNRQITESTGANTALKILFRENKEFLEKDLIKALKETELNLDI